MMIHLSSNAVTALQKWIFFSLRSLRLCVKLFFPDSFGLDTYNFHIIILFYRHNLNLI